MSGEVGASRYTGLDLILVRNHEARNGNLRPRSEGNDDMCWKKVRGQIQEREKGTVKCEGK